MKDPEQEASSTLPPLGLFCFDDEFISLFETFDVTDLAAQRSLFADWTRLRLRSEARLRPTNV